MPQDLEQFRVSALPSADKYWKQQFETNGDTKPEPIFEAVGYALSAWENTEFDFAQLFWTFTGEQSFAARRAYGTIDMNAGRRTALVAAAEIYFQEIENRQEAEEELRRELKRDKREFAILIEHFGRASSRRNEIAHGTVLELLNKGCFLAPPWYNSKKYRAVIDPARLKIDEFEKVRAEYRYTRDNIVKFGQRFARLGNAVTAFWVHLRDHYPQPRGSLPL